MALVRAETVVDPARGFNGLPVLRQIGLMVGLAASVALGVAVVLWSQTPNYSPLYGKLSSLEAAQVVDELERAGIDHKLEQGGTLVMVPSSDVHQARLKLATAGLPNSDGAGFEILDKNPGFGTSRFMEQARYQRAIEGELARSIATLESVESARVHLAIPKRSAFVRRRAKPRASVVLNLYSGARLDDSRLAGIAHLVAASVPDLEAGRVTVVDQKGRLLTASQGSSEMALSASQLSYSRKLEELYVKRIHDLLAPIVGENGVRAQVSAEIDFTVREKTAESYLPQNKAVRSEEISEENMAGAGASGVPGALTNQPPSAGVVDSNSPQEEAEPPVSSSRHSTRNYELDRSIVHTRTAPGTIERISVAVLVDYRTRVNSDGVIERVPLETEELERITGMVKEAVGFNEKRNDSVNVTNMSFKAIEEVEALPEPPVWKQPWIWDVVKQAVGVMLVLLLAFGVLRPALRSLAVKPEPGAAGSQGALPGGMAAGQFPLANDRLSLGAQQPVGIAQQEQQYGIAKTMIENDPKRVAKVVKTWVAADG